MVLFPPCRSRSKAGYQGPVVCRMEDRSANSPGVHLSPGFRVHAKTQCSGTVLSAETDDGPWHIRHRHT